MTSLPIELLQVNLLTTGDYISPKPIIFKPNVAIFFTTKVFLDKDILKNNKIDIKPSLFLNNEVFDKAIRLMDDNNYSDEEILKNNIDLFRKALFSQEEKIPIGSKIYLVLKSTYLPDSFKKSTAPVYAPMQNTPSMQNVLKYTITYKLYILDSQRNLQPGDFKRGSCKLKAKELNQQAKDIFGVSLGLDSDFPPVKVAPTTNAYGTNAYGYGANAYNANAYGANAYGYGANAYGTNPYGTNPYGTNPYGTNPYGTNPYGTNPYGTNPTIQRNEELLKTKRDIRTLLKDYELKKDTYNRDQNILEWQDYKERQINDQLPVIGMNEWIKKREQDYLENKYKLDWLNYKAKYSNGSTLERWLKDKLEEELENKVDYYTKEWLTYKSLTGRQANLNQWLKEQLEKDMQVQQQRERIGGKKKRKTHNKKTHNKKTHNKKTLKKLRKRSKKMRKRSNTINDNTIKLGYYDTSKIHPASIIL